MIVLTEIATINNLCSLFRFPEGDGITCPGGSFSNLLALLTARNLKFPKIKTEGLSIMNNSPLVVFSSAEGHYSIKKACMVLGIGINQLILIPTDSNGCMKSNILKSEIEKALQQGKSPLFVNATAGTTVRGSFDPFQEIGEICREFNIWFHIDGCLGGSVIFSNKYSYLLNGCELSDSISWNAHKMLGIPIQTSILLMKNKNALIESNSFDDISYLYHDDNKFDVGKKTIMCGRRADILKLYITWQYYGSKTFESWVDHAFENAIHFTKMLNELDDFVVLFDTQSVNVCFQYVPLHLKSTNCSTDKISEINQNIYNALTEKGEIFIDTNSSPELGVYFRVSFHSPFTKHCHLQKIITQIRDLTKESNTVE